MIQVAMARPREGERPRDYMEAALGTIDQYGNPFELITLRWIGKNVPYAKTQGFEDTIIEHAPGGAFSITYRQGSVSWYRELGNVYEGLCAKTPHNMKTLAHNYFDGLWKIKDVVVDAAVKAMAQKIEDDLSPKMKKYNDERRRDGRRTPFEKAEQMGMPVDELMATEAKHNVADSLQMSARQRKLDAKEAKLNEDRGKLDAERAKLATQIGETGVSTVGYSRDALDEMHLSRVKRILREEFKQETPLDMKKTEAVEQVILLQSGGAPQPETAPEPAAVTE